MHLLSREVDLDGPPLGIEAMWDPLPRQEDCPPHSYPAGPVPLLYSLQTQALSQPAGIGEGEGAAAQR